MPNLGTHSETRFVSRNRMLKRFRQKKGQEFSDKLSFVIEVSHFIITVLRS